MKSMLTIQLVLTAAAAIAVTVLYGLPSGLSVLGGGAVMLLNLAALLFSWPRILAKKSVALSIGVIVFKFAILGWILYEVVNGQLIHLGWFAVGMALVIPTVIATALKIGPNSPEKAEI